MHLVPENIAAVTGQHSYNEVLPLMLIRYCGPGLLGLGITALVAGFMSGMAGNVSAFSTVWTYDLYGAYLNKKASDKHYVAMGRWSTVIGMSGQHRDRLPGHERRIHHGLRSISLQLLHRTPSLAPVILGMLWKRATKEGGFWGLAAGTASSIGMWVWVQRSPQALGIIALSSHAQGMAENLYRALWSWIICVIVTVVVSYATKPTPIAELAGLVYGSIPEDDESQYPMWQRPIFWAIVVIVVFFALNIIFF